MKFLYHLIVIGLVAVSPTVDAADWPAFRGPAGNGISTETSFPTHWGPSKNIKWKIALPTPANGSPIVARGRVLLTCCSEDGRERTLHCFDRNDGRQLWARTVEFKKKMRTHRTNPYGGSTPASDGRLVVVWHSSAGLYCYDLSGNQQWSRDLGEFDHMWGYGSSPVIFDGRVFLNSGPGKERVFVAAFDLATGRTIWEQEEPFEGDGDRRPSGDPMGSWSTPVIANVEGEDQLICTMPTRINAYDLDTGEIVWTCDGIRGPKGDLAYSSPMISEGLCVTIAGYGGPSIGLKLGGRGNITEANRLWRLQRNPQSIGSGVFIDGCVYRVNAARPSPVQCLDPHTGKVLWTGPAGGSCWGSLVYAAGKLYATTQDATTIVFQKDSDEYREIARNELGETSNSTPAFSDGEIFLRTYEHLYCIANE